MEYVWNADTAVPELLAAAPPPPRSALRSLTQTAPAVSCANYHQVCTCALPKCKTTSNSVAAAPPPRKYCRDTHVNLNHHHHPHQQLPVAHPPTSYAYSATCAHPHSQSQHEFDFSRYSGCDRSNRITDEEDSAFPALLERELHALHRNVPALRRSGIDTSTIRQHYYPDGGWGWIICGMSFLAHVLTSGFQLSYGLLMFYAAQHLKHDRLPNSEWVGAVSWTVSSLAAPIVISFCRKKSTRLAAVLGGVVLPLGILFTSFATQLTQVTLSYGILVGVAVAMVRESSTIILGNYFKKRREFVEMVAMTGEGVGVTLFTLLFKEGLGKLGWRLGLQIIAGVATLTFFMGLLYRPASLYHPQRRAIQHLKNQRKKIKERKPAKDAPPKPHFIDFTPFKSTTVRILVLTTAISALGIFAPIFLLSLQAAKEGRELPDLVLLQACLGLSMALGVVSSATVVKNSFTYKGVVVSSQHVSQISLFTMSLCTLCLSFVFGYRELCVICWVYGFSFGSFRFAFKSLVLERVRAKHFTKTWGLIRGAESLPVLISIPLTSFLNEYSSKYGRAGHYICSAASSIAGIVIFFIGYAANDTSNFAKLYGNGSVRSTCEPAHSDYPPYVLNKAYPSRYAHSHQCSPCTTLSHTYNLQHFDQYRTPRSSHPNLCYYNSLPRMGNLRCSCKVRLNKAEYKFGSGSVGAKMGRQLQRGLANAICTCSTQNGCVRASFSYQRRPTCAPGHHSYSAYPLDHNALKSLSVPEGLATASAQCTCPTQSQSQFSYNNGYGCRQRSQSLSKHMHLVEQITTSL